MDFDEYQALTQATAIYPGQGWFAGLTYAALGLNGEAGEVAEKVKKALRDDGGELTVARRAEIEKELGDVLWYVARVTTEIGSSFGRIAEQNIDKLADRHRRDVLTGSGDER
jgi:NTP pyrophosphatase (non-canonical NTP hydrolase)